ncbi:unnamed protein product [Thlaspi arvense]|uniref:Nodulation signaling pathway 2-like protein n=1 Tax=Thlaspi arvense TaxID=13288 RepID=A0AAU9STT4_THLAR|nr:unnamed protein product [Thlaspi arvense]
MNYPYDDFLDLFFSSNTATAASTSSCVEHNDGSLDMDWDSDFHDLIESMMSDEGAASESPPMLPCHLGQEGICNSVSMGLSVADGVLDNVERRSHDESKGLRLKDLVSPSDQTNMERLAAHFTNGLSKLLERANVKRQCGPHQHHDVHDQADVITAFEMLQNISLYVNFGYFTATQAILEAVKYEGRIHIVDYDITEGVKWASLMHALVSKNTDPSAQHLRITALSRATNGKKSVAAVQEAGRRLTAFAESIGQPFSYQHCKLDTDTFNASSLTLVRGEAMVINCMLHLPRFIHQPPNSLISFLSEAKVLNPKLVTLVHEEVGLMGNQGFLYRFMDLQHQFSAIFDSLEASPVRSFIEHIFIGPWVSGWLTRIAITAGDAEVESFASWPQWLEANGFKPGGRKLCQPLSSKASCELV